MKRLSQLILGLFSVIFGLNTSLGYATTQSQITYSQAQANSERESTGRYSKKLLSGVGLSTINVMPFVSIGGFASNTSITALRVCSDVNLFQFLVSIPQTSPFNLGVMGLYKRVILESQYAGLHLGGGLGLAD